MKVKVNNCFAGRIKQFLQNWQKLTNDKNVLRIVKGSNLKTNPAKSPTRNSILENRGTTSGLGGCQHVEKRSHKNCYSKREPVAEQYLHKSKKGWGIQTNYKPKKAESICTLPTFQNGGFAGCKEYAQRRGPHVQIRSERRLFYRSPKHKIQKTSKISVEKETIRVPVSSFRTGTSTQGIHKITQSPNFNMQETEHPPDNILGRPVTNGIELPGNLLGT